MGNGNKTCEVTPIQELSVFCGNNNPKKLQSYLYSTSETLSGVGKFQWNKRARIPGITKFNLAKVRNFIYKSMEEEEDDTRNTLQLKAMIYWKWQ